MRVSLRNVENHDRLARRLRNAARWLSGVTEDFALLVEQAHPGCYHAVLRVIVGGERINIVRDPGRSWAPSPEEALEDTLAMAKVHPSFAHAVLTAQRLELQRVRR